MACPVQLGSYEQTINYIVIACTVLSFNSASFMILGLLDSQEAVKSSHSQHKLTVRNLILVLSVCDLFWAFVVGGYDLLLVFVGNMGYCAYWLCILTRPMVHFFAMMTVLTTCCISIYIFLGFFQYLETRDASARQGGCTIFNYFFFFSFFFSLLAAISILAFGPLNVTESGWCEPPSLRDIFYIYIPILLMFVLILLVNAMSMFRYYFVYHSVNSERINVLRRLLGYVIGYFVIWSPDVVFITTWAFVLGVRPPTWVHILKLITINSAGFVDLIVYGLVNDAFRGRYDTYCGQMLIFWLFAPFLLLYSLFEKGRRLCCGASVEDRALDEHTNFGDPRSDEKYDEKYDSNSGIAINNRHYDRDLQDMSSDMDFREG